MQQINLYQPIFKQQKKVFSATTLLELSGFFVVGLVVFSLFAWWQLYELDKQLTVMEQRREEARNRLNSLTAQLPKRTGSTELKNLVSSLKNDVEKKRQIVAMLKEDGANNTRGFSHFLEALSRQHPPQLWLTQISIHGGGTSITLSGSTYAETEVPIMLTNLSQEPSFRGISFKSMQIERIEQSNAMRFSLSTNEPEGAPQ